MRMLFGLVILAVAGAVVAPAAAPPVAPGDVHDIVLLHPKRPYRIRFHLRVAGHSFKAGWNRQVGQLFAFLDGDGDGRLSPAEAGHAPSHEQWRQMSSGKDTIEADKAPAFADLARGKPHCTLDDLQAYYAASTAGPLQVSWAWRVFGDDLVTDMLWKKLDVNRDGKLSREELLAARTRLSPLDLDDDDIISQDELMGRFYSLGVPVATPGPSHGLAHGGLPFISVLPGVRPEVVTGLFLQRYDRDRSGAVTRERFGLPAEQFTRLDRDGDGRLDAGELAAWLDQPPDLELEVPLDAPTQPIRKLAGPSADLHYTATMRSESIRLHDWLIELHRPAPLLSRPRDRRADTLALFRQLDRDSNGYLDSAEVFLPPFRHVSWMRLADRDGDGKVSRKEFSSFADLNDSLQGQVTFLRAENSRQSLFRLIDQNGDGRLGPREMNLAWDRLRHWAKDGGLDRASLPTLYRLTLGHGTLAAIRTEEGLVAPIRPLPSRGPLWFRKMDRNGDGDISIKEWLGTREQFAKLDTDGDGLISVEEAVAADRSFREGKR